MYEMDKVFWSSIASGHLKYMMVIKEIMIHQKINIPVSSYLFSNPRGKNQCAFLFENTNGKKQQKTIEKNLGKLIIHITIISNLKTDQS